MVNKFQQDIKLVYLICNNTQDYIQNLLDQVFKSQQDKHSHYSNYCNFTHLHNYTFQYHKLLVKMPYQYTQNQQGMVNIYHFLINFNRIHLDNHYK